MQLTGPQLKRLHSLLLRAFPSYKDLKRLTLFGLDLNLDTIVDSHDLNAAVFDLLNWSHARDKDGELVASAVEANSDNQALRAFASEIGVLAAPTPAAPAVAASRYRTLVVDPLHRGDYLTISEAIAAAHPGDHISVRPGIYTEGLVIDKPLEIVGEGERAEIVVKVRGAHVIRFQASAGRVRNLTLRQTGGESWYGVDITQGRLELEHCDISSSSSACVGIHNGAGSDLRGNRIHYGSKSGVVVYEQGQGLLEDNDIRANANYGVEIKTGGNPTLRGNRIQDNDIAGVSIYQQGQGLLEDNDIMANAYYGVEIKTEGNPTLRGNRIHGNNSAGVFIYESGQGTLVANNITANTFYGVEIRTGGNPILHENRIHRNAVAISIQDGGFGTFGNNDLQDNTHGPWDIAPECLSNVKRSGNTE